MQKSKLFNRIAICLLTIPPGVALGVPPRITVAGSNMSEAGSNMNEVRFKAARPVWPAGREKEMNVLAGFRGIFNAPPGHDPVTLRLAASTSYRAFVNGEFLGSGPARGPHGYFRVDEWDISRRLRPGQNVVAIEVAGYNVNSFAWLDQASFLQAEVVAGDAVLASTSEQGMPITASVLRERVQKVQRYSFMRPFSEAYRLAPGYDQWHSDPFVTMEETNRADQPPVKLLPRRVPYPKFDCRPAVWHIASGRLLPGKEVKNPWKDRSLANIGPQLKGYPEKELEVNPALELQGVETQPGEKVDKPLGPDATLRLASNSYHIVDFGTNLTGTIGAHIKCRETTRLFFTFDEVLTDGDVDFKRLGCVNIVALELQPGDYAFESYEPYTLRYLKLMTLGGDCVVDRMYLRELANPDVYEAHFACSDLRLNRLFDAGRENLRQNAVDIFMDCPSRERGGYLCDSFFTSRAAKDLTGDTRVEKNFYENYLLPEKFAFIPDGMLPMCYPSDHNDGLFIPNWAMWFVVQLEEYQARSGDRELVSALQPRIMKLLDYFKAFRNSDGLLEKLSGWVFVEWSAANNFVQDVNYPSNMLYAATLSATGRLYNRPDLVQDAERIRAIIRRQAFDGHFFIDNAVRKDGRLEVTKSHTETCQYYAFFFDIATPQTHPDLWKILTEQFGPQREQTRAFPDVPPSNSFIGNMLRVEMLSRYGRSRQILDESIGYLLYMADRTGTLWENIKPEASCNHGFASHIVHTLYRDILGVRSLDTVNKKLRLRFADVDLQWCEGRIPVPGGFISLRWWKDGDTIVYRVDTPAGYTLQEDHPRDLKVKRLP